tara:strand:- start:199 stop:1284 length:1086 start_codon:yes stop_codon:yes gene_type:complete
MAERKIDAMIEGGTDNRIDDFSVQPEVTDSAADQKETEYINNNWAQQFGYFNQIPELNATINAKATWTIGKGFKADEITEMLLDTIKGWGTDTFNTILENMIRTYYISGDSFAEIIRDDEGNLINIKTLSPDKIKIVVNRKGIITKYKVLQVNGQEHTFQPEEIFHLSRNRVADQIHGCSVIDPLEKIILARNESIDDYRTVMHDNVTPRWKFKLKTDDPTEIAAYKAKMDAVTTTKSANVYEPFDVSESELISVAPNATLDPKAWIDQQGDFFYEAVGVPQIILGGSGEFTEASAKIAYLAFQQNIEEEQLFIEEEVLSQLNLVIELEFPASLENELLSDKSKDGAQNIDASETTAGAGQ